MLDQEHLRETEARCTQEAAPRCQGSCPLRMDVRGFMAHMKDGKLTQARGLLERHLPLPGILARICDHPCESVCLRRDLGGSLAIHALEKSCMDATARPRPLPRRQKEGSVAVLGNGLAGLTAAFDLHRKGFAVTVFHEGEPTSTLLRRFPALDARVAQEELEELEVLAGEGLRFVRATLDSVLHEKAGKEFTVVCVDADAASGIAARAADVDPVTLCAAETVCHCGWLSVTPTGHSYASASAQAGEGRRAAVTLERVLTGVSLTAARPDVADGRQLHTPLDGITPVPRVVPASISADVWTPQECAEEAARCLLCQCMACVRECVYLQKYRGYPRTYTRQIHNNAAIVKGQHMANSLVNGCALCGQCTEICPERFSMADLCLTARRDMVERGTMPPSAHEFALEDMESATGGNALFLPDPQKSDAQHVEGGASPKPLPWALMPGCQLWAARGEQVLALHSHVRAVLAAQDGQKDAGGNTGGGESGGLGLILSCCGVPARWAGREDLFQSVMADFRARWEGLGRPRLLCACSSCLSLLKTALPESQPLSVWEVLAAVPQSAPKAASPAAADARQILSIHDPCTARHDVAWQQAVRELVRRQCITVHEPRRSGVETPCCGYGGLVWNAQPELADAMTTHRAAELLHTGLASCIMCRDRLVAQGKPCLHVLDILPATEGLSPQRASDGAVQAASADPAAVKGPGLSARRAARDALRRSLREEWLGQVAPQAPETSLEASIEAPILENGGRRTVLLAAEVLERLEARHILRQDVEETVRGAESSGNCFEDQESGHSLGSWTPRHVTFWVEYSVTDAGYVVHDAWCHRMRVPGADSITGSPCAVERTES